MKKGKKYKKSIAQSIFSKFMLLAWLCFIAFASFHAPSFLAQTPIFKVKEVIVEGNDKIDFHSVKEVVESLGKSILTLTEKNIQESLNKKFAGRVEKVRLNRELSTQGVKVHITIKERRPVAKLKLGASTYLVDAKGIIFKPMSDEGKGLTTITTYSLSALEKNFKGLYEGILSSGLPLRKVEIHKDKIVLLLKNKEVILPPIDMLPDNISRRLKIIYNLKGEKVDLRFRRFILVRN